MSTYYDLCWIGAEPGTGKLHILDANGRGRCENYGAHYRDGTGDSPVKDADRIAQPTCKFCLDVISQ
jgi:hypothetical protein